MRAGSYLDTSFLIKLYVTEPDSGDAVSWFRRNVGEVFISSLTDLEVAAALYRKLPAARAAEAHKIFLEDRVLGVYRKVNIDETVFEDAGALVVRCADTFRLRSLDAIHLASALHTSAAEFATYDARLAGAAMFMGLKVFPGRS
jgi:predicted nucleic acid-binding protein